MTGNLDEFRRSVLLPPAVGLQFRSPLVLYSGGGTSCLLVVSSYLETTILYYTILYCKFLRFLDLRTMVCHLKRRWTQVQFLDGFGSE